MKKYIMISGCLLFTASFVNATVRTVSNNAASIAQFSTIQAAIDASSNGDTVYVQGSPVSYAGFTISNKQLVVIGPGWSPDKSLPHLATMSSLISLTGAGTSGTEIQGLTTNSGISIVSAGINNIRIIRNHLMNVTFQIQPGGAGTFSGYLFEGNWFTQSGINVQPSSTYQNFIIQNNIFHMNDCCSGNSMTDGFMNSVNVLFNHNLFYGITGANNVFGTSCRFLLLNNNIFVRRNANAVNSTFTNNITFNTTNNSPWTTNGNTDGGGNITNQDPQMVDQSVVNSGTDNALLDFTIPAGPANNSGTDGKDMGLLYDVTGSLNWANSRNSRLPRIIKMNIVNSTVAVGGTISISVEAKTSN
jgi:hypothetical protein